MDSDELVIIDDDTEGDQESDTRFWEVLIADDDEQVHEVTKLVLADMEFDGQPIRFHSTFSGQETMNFLDNHSDISILLLDVVMECEDAGLRVAQYVRQKLQNTRIRIILRTGQAGQAPERQIIDDYEINDYKEKVELTSEKLYTTMKSAFRAYRDIVSIDRSKRGLENIIKASLPLFHQGKKLDQFMSAVLEQIDALLKTDHSVVYVRNSSFVAVGTGSSFEIVTGSSAFAGYVHEPLDRVVTPEIYKKIMGAVKSGTSVFEERCYIGFFRSLQGVESVLYVQTFHPLTPLDQSLLNLYSTNVTLSFENLLLNQDILSTQKEIIYTVGELIETRSKETGNHIKRVVEFAMLLGKHLALTEEELELLENSVALHDVGKLAIPDAILSKPSKLTPDEMEIIKTHTTTGFQILKNSRKPIFQTAALIARDHHERWDGTGYPAGLQGEDIGLFARITAAVDVFDALSSKRCYKEVWPEPRIREYFEENRGKHFSPDLAQVVLDRWQEFLAIREQYPDF